MVYDMDREVNCVCGEEGCLPVSVSPYYVELRCLNILQLRVCFSEPPDLECALMCGCGHMRTHHYLWELLGEPEQGG